MKVTKSQINYINELYKPLTATEILKVLPNIFKARVNAPTVEFANKVDGLLNCVFTDNLAQFEKEFLWFNKQIFNKPLPTRESMKPNFVPLVQEALEGWIKKYDYDIVIRVHKEYEHRSSMFDHTEIIARNWALGDIILMANLHNYGHISLDTYPPVLEDGMYSWCESKTASAIEDMPKLLTHIMLDKTSKEV